MNTITVNAKHEDWHDIVKEDVKGLIEAEKSYGDSWKKRGGVDSFMMLARKWDRIEHQVEKKGFNILKAGVEDTRPEGILDDIQDLRRYLILVENEIRMRQMFNNCYDGTVKDAASPGPEYVDQDR